MAILAFERSDIMKDEDLEELARSVADLLGEGWRFREDDEDWRTFLDNGDGPSIMFNTTWHQGRLALYGYLGDLHNFLPHDYKRPEITVSLDSDAERVAKQIKSRLLPNYSELWRIGTEKKRRV